MYLIDLQIETSLVSHFMELVDDADRNKDGKIDFDEWLIMGSSSLVLLLSKISPGVSAVARIKQRIPMAQDHMGKVRLFSLRGLRLLTGCRRSGSCLNFMIPTQTTACHSTSSVRYLKTLGTESRLYPRYALHVANLVSSTLIVLSV